MRVCKRCDVEISRKGAIYCGNRTKKTGCSYIVHLERANKGVVSSRKSAKEEVLVPDVVFIPNYKTETATKKYTKQQKTIKH